jgi:hypothetical protein
VVRIDQSAIGIALVVDDERRLLATITDGDIRRALHQLASISASRSSYCSTSGRRGRRKSGDGARRQRAVAAAGLMSRHALRHVPRRC